MATGDPSGSMTESSRDTDDHSDHSDHDDHDDHDLHDGTSILSSARTLSTLSDQEALELQPQGASTFPTLVGTSHGSHKISRWWKRHVFLAVPHVACRDHLANERTFLGYLRTGQAFAMLGVIIAQLMRLQHSAAPNPVLGYFVISVPLSCVCHASAISFSFLGAIRFLRLQNEMARGHAVAGGWEIKFAGTITTLVVLTMFVLALAITIEKA